ncbi:hypothetical protein HUB98_13330 [Paenibacillus barcinonensis]|uniref:DNA polymerase III beta subunit-like protein n=1 Tax=Paenibacillus barcinonensis TaxID=198119 RepID=A0A2V4VT92_PAEBA|nr:hypothetical protein [Paenibacillus barcinonensis]PYE42125.1 hypothetical protein DFQ00_14222 [Paenibacillus barcinonensis]QKS57201.1 hypothetical protein HUB98_13330 [Paenibacillus barcinonensis]
MNKQEVLAKYGKKFAAPPKVGGVLEGIHYATDGAAYVTNRHVALIVRDVHQLEHPIILHAKTEMPIEGAYPDMSQIIPTFFSKEIKVYEDIKNVLVRVAAADGVATSINKKVPVAQIEAENGTVRLLVNSSRHHIEFSTVLGNTPDALQMGINTEHLLLALSVFADSMADQVYVRSNGGMGRMMITDKQGIEVLILPHPSTGEGNAPNNE